MPPRWSRRTSSPPALDEDHLRRAGDLADPLGVHGDRRQATPLPAGGGLGGQRVAQPDELVGGQVVTDEPPDLVDVTRLTGRHPVCAGFTTATVLPLARTTAARAAVTRLAHAGARAGHEDHGGQRARVSHEGR